MPFYPHKDRQPTDRGCLYVAPSADVIGEVELGPEVSVWHGCVLRADLAPIVIGANSNVQDLTVVHVDADAPTIIGRDVTIGHRAVLHACRIGDGSLIGMGAIILDHAEIPVLMVRPQRKLGDAHVYSDPVFRGTRPPSNAAT